MQAMADDARLRELNNDIWYAFTSAYAARDLEAFLAVHSPELIRAGGPEGHVLNFDEYAAQTREWFAKLIEDGHNVAIELRFTERLASEATASERGVFRIVGTGAGGDERVFYSRFHTFARKTEGRWRIVVDYDSNEGGSIGDEAFAAATPIDDVAAFAG
jgi:ketosteroid isomerase-like protein